MEKKHFFALSMAIAFLSVAVITGIQVSTQSKTPALLMENVEALTNPDNEVVITCSGGNSGQCFRKTPYLKFCGSYSYYECTYTGYMKDQCYRPC